VQSREGGGFKLKFFPHGNKFPHTGFLERLFAKIPFLQPDTAALAVKDLRMFLGATPRNGARA